MNYIRRSLKPWVLVAGLTAWSILFVACMTTGERTLTATKVAPGAKVAGAKECATCHAEVAAKFVKSTHAKLSVNGADETAAACETCHGPGSVHIKAGGGKGTIINPAKTPETCFQCHADKRGQFSLPNSHPVLAGKVTCSDCHDVHQRNSIKGKGASTLESEKETCTKCHTNQKGPFVFVHNAMREGCTACHNPHGTVNSKMLVARDANLCLKCHLVRPTVVGNGHVVAGPEDHRTRLQNGNCWTAGCHEAVHGSNSSKPLRY